MPRTSHVATRPKKHVSDASVPRCRGLLQQALPPVCLWLVVEGVLGVIRTRYLDTRTCSWTMLYSFFFFFSASSSKQLLEDCLLLLAAAVSVLFRCFSRFLLRQSVCARAAWWLHYTKEAGQPTIYTWNKSDGCATINNVFIRTSFKKNVRAYSSTLSSLRK